jgi:hypothetical protein
MKKILFILFFVALSPVLKSQPTCNFTGTWSSMWDGIPCTLYIYSNGEGSYSYMLNGVTVSGTLSGSVSLDYTDGNDSKMTFRGTWSESSGASGGFEFGRLCSIKAFEGRWWNANGQESGFWAGTM